MEIIRTLIVDDELLARVRIRNLLRDRAEFTLVGECGNGAEAVAAIGSERPELLFLDVQMPDLDGFGVLRTLFDRGIAVPTVIVFVTAWDRYALRAFEVHALDYLLKPFDDERFEQTLDWVRRQSERDRLGDVGRRMMHMLEDFHRPPAAAAAPPPESRIVVKSGGRLIIVPAEEIDWVEAEGYYARLHVGGRSHLLRESLQRLEAQLDAQRFRRIHRSAIVNLLRVRELVPQSHGEYAVVLTDGTRLKLSRSYRENLLPLLDRLRG